MPVRVRRRRPRPSVMVCKKAPGKIARHPVLNDVIWRALNAAGIPATKEPSGINRRDGKRPDGLTLIPWQGGKPLVWDVTVASTDTAATGMGLVADQAAIRKSAKYVDFTAAYILRWRTWGLSMLQHWISSVICAKKSAAFPATTERRSSCSSASL